MSRQFGSPADPVNVKCTSLGRPAKDRAYWSIVAADGTQLCLGMTFDQLRLIASQASEAVAGWPVSVEKPCDVA